MAKRGFVYILSNRSRTVLYTGVTSDLARRIQDHKDSRDPDAFTSRYRATRLVWYEVADDMYTAISREKQIKAGPRRRKIELIAALNPEWKDLSDTL